MLNQLPEPTEPFSTYAEAQRRAAQVVRCALGAAIHLSLGVDQHYSSSEPLVIVDSATRPSGSPNLPRPSAPRSSPARQDAGGERPTGGNDPSSVAGYRLLSLLGAGGTADVFHAVAPVSGARVAVKIIRTGGIGETCQREYELASAVDASSTAAPIEYGLSAAGPYLPLGGRGWGYASVSVGLPAIVGLLVIGGLALTRRGDDAQRRSAEAARASEAQQILKERFARGEVMWRLDTPASAHD